MLDDLAQLHGQVLGTFELHRMPTNLRNASDHPASWKQSIQKEIQWSVQLPEDIPMINIDQDRIAQAIGICSATQSNLLPW